MSWEWLTINKLVDPSSSIGALALALVVFAFACLVSIITSRLLKRPIWATGKLKRRVNQTVVRYVLRIKNLVIIGCYSIYKLYAHVVYSACVSECLAHANYDTRKPLVTKKEVCRERMTRITVDKDHRVIYRGVFHQWCWLKQGHCTESTRRAKGPMAENRCDPLL
jgi:hypothetical protein